MTYRSDTVTQGKMAAAARSLFRATGVKNTDFGKPIIAVANSFTEIVPGHVHLNGVGRIVSDAIWQSGGIPREFNTIAVDDGIAMGHDGMLYSLPSQELIADSIEYMANAHCADAIICISNCDKITLGMLIAAMRLNIPAIFVSGGPMEAGVEFTMRDIDTLSRKVPYLCKVAPATSNYFMEEVHKAGGVVAILGEFNRAGLLNVGVPHLALPEGTLADVLSHWDVMETRDEYVKEFYRADASGVKGAQAYSHNCKEIST